jgi:hypothetical protein
MSVGSSEFNSPTHKKLDDYAQPIAMMRSRAVADLLSILN